MIIRRRQIIVTVLFLLLTLATSAFAESAWVLWSRASRSGSFVWTPLDTFESKWFCEELAKVMAAEFKQRAGGILACWPDSLDPRTSESADGAWVLWMGALNPPPGREGYWRPLHSYTVLDQCQFDEKTMSENDKLKAQSFKFQFVCLPDTVDPRGPKGK